MRTSFERGPNWNRFGYGVLATLITTLTLAAENPWPAASHVPDSQPGWEAFETKADPDAPLDEAQGGMTARGTPIAKRNEECFPAEERNLFSEMDMVASGPNGALEPFAYSSGQAIDKSSRDAIRGQNTWILWGEGNEAFWGWIQERGYGLVDFLVMLDSRKRDVRFKDTGMMNQPGMKQQTDPAQKLLGLYLDVGDGDNILMKQPATDIDAATGKLAERRMPPGNPKHPTQLFKPGDEKLYRDVLARLPRDGVDTTVYGYPSGVVGLRLFPNPDFFGDTPGAAQARRYWDERVVKRPNDEYYETKTGTSADPDLVRPFRVTMSCGFCHIGPHPLNPPTDPEKPQWSNLSSTIGNQYWTPPTLFANLTDKSSLLYQFLASQQPGTVDTSLVSTDHIANTITAVFDINARLARATLNPPEKQSAANLLFPGVEDGGRKVSPRHTPRVLVDGSDSIGVFGALSRVYLNIGTHPQEWARCHNPVVGFKPQRPFSVATLNQTSVFWRAADKYRIPYLAAFFTHASGKTGESIVAPMKLATAPGGKAIVDAEHDLAAKGRGVFLQNCAICHSSKQPEGFELAFKENWAGTPVPNATEPAHFTLPTQFDEWERFRASPMFAEYRRRIVDTAQEPQGAQDAFLKDNFLSTDIRVPVTLVGTNSGRAVGTNAMRGQVWSDFSSDDYKNLSAVGGIRFFNPYSGATRDEWDNNDTYYPPPGGPGYYRPASLISLWATSPYLHNNALGLFNRDPSVQGRLQGFDDGIDKLLSRDKRKPSATDPYGDLRHINAGIGAMDPGFIYRVAEDSSIAFAAKFIPQLLTGILGERGVAFLTHYLWIGLAVIAIILVFVARSRFAGFTLVLLAVLSAALLVLTRLDKVWGWLWIVPVAGVALAVWVLSTDEKRWFARLFFAVLAVASLLIGHAAHRFAEGSLGAINAGPIPMGTPINLLMNINPEAPTLRLVRAVAGLTRGLLLSQRETDPQRRREVFENEAGLALLGASKCPDFVLDRGHWFGEKLTPEEKTQLKTFLKTL